MGLGRFLADGLVWLANRMHPGYRNIDDVIRDNIAVWDGDGPKIKTINDAPPEIAAQYRDWQRGHYSAESFEVRRSESITSHTAGGPPLHQGANCDICKRPLMNFWTLDGDVLRESLPALFKERTKLSIYHCPGHGDATCYRLLSDQEAVVFPGTQLHDESPFLESDETSLPAQLTPGFLKVRSIPRPLSNLMVITNKYGLDYLLDNEITALRNYLEF